MLKSKPGKEKGQSLVELALTATFMLFLLLGLIDTGFGFLYWISIRDAAEEGATYGSLHPGTGCQATLRNWVRDASTSPLLRIDNLPDDQIIITRTGTSPGNTITVKVIYNYNILSPFPPFLPPTIPISTSATLTILKKDTTCP